MMYRSLITTVASLLLCACANTNQTQPLGVAAEVPANLGWDFEYKKARSQSKMHSNEVMQYWPTLKHNKHRPIEQEIANYTGEKIEASLLLEGPDLHYGEPYARWVIVTKSKAMFCYKLFKKEKECKPLDRQKAKTGIDEIYAFPPLKDFDPDKRVSLSRSDPTKGPKQVRMNYLQFLSIYKQGHPPLQRPVAVVELDGHASPEEFARLGDQTNRISTVLTNMQLSDEAANKERVKQAKVRVVKQFEDAAAKGKIQRMEKLLAENKRYLGTAEISQVLPVVVKAKRKDVIDFLIANGANLDTKESAALKAAVNIKSLDMISYLLDKGAQPDPPPESLNIYGYVYASPLADSVSSSHGEVGLEMAKLLIKRGADVNLKQDMTVITHAAVSENVSMVDFLLSQGADPEMPFDGSRGTLAHLLAKYSLTEGKAQVIRRLIKAGVNPSFDAKCGSYLFLIERHVGSEKQRILKRSLMLELGAKTKAEQSCKEPK